MTHEGGRGSDRRGSDRHWNVILRPFMAKEGPLLLNVGGAFADELFAVS
jgi:hypothetical protein